MKHAKSKICHEYVNYCAKRLIYSFLLISGFISNLGAETSNNDPVREKVAKVVKGSEYVICIEGGGSITRLQVVSPQGTILPIYIDGEKLLSVDGEGSNINTLGKENVERVIKKLCSGFAIGKNKVDIAQVKGECAIVAGIAGLGSAENKQIMQNIFRSLGFKPERIALFYDAEMALSCLDKEGAVLIAGTGTIFLGKKDNQIIRVGGLGRLIGDEGSGYWIGMQGIKHGLEDEYGWGQKTSITERLRVYFDVHELKDIIRKIHSGEISPTKIAASSRIVFEEARAQDPVSESIVNAAAIYLGDMLYMGLKQVNKPHATVYLIGGIFKNKNTKQFIKYMFDNSKLKDLDPSLMPVIVNRANDNMATCLVHKTLGYPE